MSVLNDCVPANLPSIYNWYWPSDTVWVIKVHWLPARETGLVNWLAIQPVFRPAIPMPM